MNRIGILHHPKVAESQPLADVIEAWLAERQVTTWQASSYDEARMREMVGGSDLLVVLGGDGSLLRAARYASVCDVPIFGINLGRVGFLSEAQPNDWPEKLGKVLDGACWLENRLMLRARIRRNGRILHTFSVLNDVVVGRGRQARERPLTLLGNTDRVWVYQRGRTLPLARLVTQAEIIPDAAAATARVHQPDFDPVTTAILEQEPDCSLAGGVPGTAVVTEKSNGYWQIQTDSALPALLVLSETAYPGWRVFVDGVEEAWDVAYTAVRATCVPVGEHTIEWRYQPRSYAIGGILSLLGLVLVGTAVWRKPM
ncbi:MAG: NAD(+)/NADH kinase [Chloroflexota bacterium]